MKAYPQRLLLLAVLFCLVSPAFSQNAKTGNAIQSDDLSRLVGNWKGTLTYLNYQDNQYVTIRTQLEIVPGADENEIKVTNSYPDEPDAGGTYRLWTSRNGKRLNKEAVSSRTVLDDGTLEIVTSYRGRDDNKRARIRITYRIGEDTYTTRKDVQYKGETEWIKRNEFTYQRQ